ncbi:hypothetical protein ACSQ67_010255 [Phaseolus vulgaris]
MTSFRFASRCESTRSCATPSASGKCVCPILCVAACELVDGPATIAMPGAYIVEIGVGDANDGFGVGHTKHFGRIIVHVAASELAVTRASCIMNRCKFLPSKDQRCFIDFSLGKINVGSAGCSVAKPTIVAIDPPVQTIGSQGHMPPLNSLQDGGSFKMLRLYQDNDDKDLKPGVTDLPFRGSVNIARIARTRLGRCSGSFLPFLRGVLGIRI